MRKQAQNSRGSKMNSYGRLEACRCRLLAPAANATAASCMHLDELRMDATKQCNYPRLGGSIQLQCDKWWGSQERLGFVIRSASDPRGPAREPWWSGSLVWGHNFTYLSQEQQQNPHIHSPLYSISTNWYFLFSPSTKTDATIKPFLLIPLINSIISIHLDLLEWGCYYCSLALLRLQPISKTYLRAASKLDSSISWQLATDLSINEPQQLHSYYLHSE